MEIIKFTESDISKAKSMQNFYEMVGIWARISDGEKIDVRQLWMNDEENSKLNKALKKNSGKNKDLKGLSQSFRDQAAAMDWLNYSPVSEASIPASELWFFSSEELPEFIASLKAKKENT